MEWILHSDVIELYLSGKDLTSNPSEMTQVYMYRISNMVIRYDPISLIYCPISAI